LLALIGYVTKMPLLYFYSESWGLTAMAIHTAILFLLLGFGLWQLGKQKNVD
jgi:hypothetical protein